jgi:hypothetical protein
MIVVTPIKSYKRKFCSILVFSLLNQSLFTPTAAAKNTTPAPSLSPTLRDAKNLSFLIALNSTAPTEKTLQTFFPSEDFGELQTLLKQKNLSFAQAAMNDAPLVDGKIFYKKTKKDGFRAIEIQKDNSVKIDGHFYRYDKSKTLAINFMRVFNALKGHHEADKMAFRARLPLFEKVIQQTTATAFADDAGLSATGKAPNASDNAREGESLFNWKDLLIQPMPKGISSAAAATRAAAVASGEAGSTAFLSATAATVLFWGAVLGATAWTANRAWTGYIHGSIVCGDLGGDKKRTYKFRFIDNNSWMWRTTDSRTFTNADIGQIFGLETQDACRERNILNPEPCDNQAQFLPKDGCSDEFAKDLTQNRLRGMEKVINAVRDWNSSGGEQAPPKTNQ